MSDIKEDSRLSSQEKSDPQPGSSQDAYQTLWQTNEPFDVDAYEPIHDKEETLPIITKVQSISDPTNAGSTITKDKAMRDVCKLLALNGNQSLEKIKEEFKEKYSVSSHDPKIDSEKATTCTSIYIAGMPVWFHFLHIEALIQLNSEFDVDCGSYYIDIFKDTEDKQSDKCLIKFVKSRDCLKVYKGLHGIVLIDNDKKMVVNLDLDNEIANVRDNINPKFEEQLRTFNETRNRLLQNSEQVIDNGASDIIVKAEIQQEVDDDVEFVEPEVSEVVVTDLTQDDPDELDLNDTENTTEISIHVEDNDINMVNDILNEPQKDKEPAESERSLDDAFRAAQATRCKIVHIKNLDRTMAHGYYRILTELMRKRFDLELKFQYRKVLNDFDNKPSGDVLFEFTSYSNADLFVKKMNGASTNITADGGGLKVFMAVGYPPELMKKRKITTMDLRMLDLKRRLDYDENTNSENQNPAKRTRSDKSPSPRDKIDDAGPSTRDMDDAGPSTKDMEDAGPSTRDMDDAGPSTRHMDDAGPSTKDMEDAGPSTRDMDDAGPSTRDMDDAGPSTRDMDDAGPSTRDMDDAGPSTKDMEDAGPSTRDMDDAGLSTRDMDDSGFSTPSTRHNTQLVLVKNVVITPQGVLKVADDVLLERSSSGRLRSYRPERVSVADGIELIDETLPSFRPPNNFSAEQDHEPDEDDIFDRPLALDSESEEEEGLMPLTLEELQEVLPPEEDVLLVDNTGDGEENIFDWTDDFTSFRGTQEDFQECAGPKIEGTRPIELFTQFWDEPLMKMIEAETNRFAEDQIGSFFETEEELPLHSRLHQWTNTTVAELYRLIAVNILMGMCLRGRIDEYWSTGILGMPGFRKIMSKDRFIILIRFLHFVNNNTISCRGTERKIAKIKPVLDYLNTKFKAAYTPRREVSIDESLLLWKGHLSWTQCIRTKAARFGIKSYELCESVSGYVLKIILYTGKGTSAGGAIFGFTSSTAKIVLELFKDYLGKGYKLFMDNFYNSITLARFLKSQKTDVVGTLNRRRVDCPQDIKNLNEKRMQKGAVESRHCGDVSVVAWKDVKLVTTVSTCHNANMAPGRRAGQDVDKPEVIHEYNKFMGGVDLKDQKLSMYLLERKRGIEWYLKVFRRLLNISILNSYVIYCSNIGQTKKLTHRQFRYKLAEELCDQFGNNLSIRSERRQGNPCARLNSSIDHFPVYKEVSGERNTKQVRFQRGRCARCSAKKERKDSNLQCSHCKVFLCVGQCWKEFHTLQTL